MILYADFHYQHLPSVLRNFDRLSTAHGVEVRSPLMDWRLVTYAFSLPSDRKIGGGYTKRILRDAMKGIVPESIRTRTKKLGFPNLKEGWDSPRGHQFIWDVVTSQRFQSSPLWEGGCIRDDLEKALVERDKTVINQAWKFVQVQQLLELFHQHKRNLQNT
ncbi:MAG: asparagine synthase-related protein [Chloroflexota bacterium]